MKLRAYAKPEWRRTRIDLGDESIHAELLLPLTAIDKATIQAVASADVQMHGAPGKSYLESLLRGRVRAIEGVELDDGTPIRTDADLLRLGDDGAMLVLGIAGAILQGVEEVPGDVPLPSTGGGSGPSQATPRRKSSPRK